jgi:predicted CoA-binding protein
MAAATEILRKFKTIAVVGLGNQPYKPAYYVSKYMQDAGYRIIPVHPAHAEVLGEKCYPTLDAIAEPVDVVNIFRRPEFVPDIVEAAIRIGAKAVWMQMGIEHPQAAKRARDAGLEVVEDACIMREHARLRAA